MQNNVFIVRNLDNPYKKSTLIHSNLSLIEKEAKNQYRFRQISLSLDKINDVKEISKKKLLQKILLTRQARTEKQHNLSPNIFYFRKKTKKIQYLKSQEDNSLDDLWKSMVIKIKFNYQNDSLNQMKKLGKKSIITEINERFKSRYYKKGNGHKLLNMLGQKSIVYNRQSLLQQHIIRSKTQSKDNLMINGILRKREKSYKP